MMYFKKPFADQSHIPKVTQNLLQRKLHHIECGLLYRRQSDAEPAMIVQQFRAGDNHNTDNIAYTQAIRYVHKVRIRTFAAAAAGVIVAVPGRKKM